MIMNESQYLQPEITTVSFTFVAGILLFVWFYFWSTNNYYNNRQHRPPWPIVPGALPIIGNFHQIGSIEEFGNKIHEWCTEFASEYGVYEFNLFGDRTIVVYSKENVQQIMTMKPNLIGRDKTEIRAVNSLAARGLFTAEGDTWKSERALVSAQLNQKNMNDYLSKMVSIIETLMDHWNKIGKNGSESVNVTTDIYNFMSDVLAITAFDKDYKFLYKPAAANFIQKLFTGLGIRGFSPYAYWDIPFIGQYLDGVGFHIDHMVKLMDELIDEYEGILKGDSNDDNTSSDSSKRFTILGKLYSQLHSTKSTMTRERTIGNLITLFVAGTDTTGSTMLFALYILSKDKVLQKELRKEAIKFDFETASVESMTANLPRIKSFLHEIHRFHAAANILSRNTEDEITLCGTKIPKDSYIMIATRYHTTRDNSCEDVPLGLKGSPPSKFCPYRWLTKKNHSVVGGDDGDDDDNDNVSFEVVSPNRKNFGFMAFGAGLRACPGRLYAESLQILFLAQFLKHFIDSSLEPGHDEIRAVLRFVDVPNCDIQLRLKSQ